MKKILSILVLILAAVIYTNAQQSTTALLLIDIQNFYFAGGRSELVGPVKAAENAARLLTLFRKEGKLVVHIRHNSEPGGEIHSLVKPLPGEKIISKSAVNCFVGTDLFDYLRSKEVDTLVICGMQTHMCVEGAVRAAYDLGYKVTLVHDACATRDLKWEKETVPARMVHVSTLATLKNYATIVSTSDFLAGK